VRRIKEVIFRQVLLTSSIWNIWRTVRRIYIFKSGLKGLKTMLWAINLQVKNFACEHSLVTFTLKIKRNSGFAHILYLKNLTCSYHGKHAGTFFIHKESFLFIKLTVVFKYWQNRIKLIIIIIIIRKSKRYWHFLQAKESESGKWAAESEVEFVSPPKVYASQ